MNDFGRRLIRRVDVRGVEAPRTFSVKYMKDLYERIREQEEILSRLKEARDHLTTKENIELPNQFAAKRADLLDKLSQCFTNKFYILLNKIKYKRSKNIMAKISKVYEVSDEEFKKIVAEADSYSDCLRALGLGTKGGSSTDILKRRIAELNCDISHFYSKSQVVAPNVKYTLDEILVENSDYNSITKLKNRLIKEHKLEYKCACCGLTTWLNKPITL